MMWRDFWNHRGLIWELVKRDLRGRYAGSTLGLTWSIIQPLVWITVYAIALGGVAVGRMGGMGRIAEHLPGEPATLPAMYIFILYLCVGIITWNVFQEGTNRCANVFVENANLIKKVAFPESILPVTVILSTIVRFLIELVIFLALVAFLRYLPGWVLIFVPVILILQIIFTFGISMLLATLNVFFRDVSHVTAIGLFILFWLTPIVYPQDFLPDWYERTILQVHPIHHMIALYRDVFLNHTAPDPKFLGVFALMSLGSLALGTFAYKRLRREIPDFI
jgi:lipopolysaccharide transport system permease protein